mgnify:FL=1
MFFRLVLLAAQSFRYLGEEYRKETSICWPVDHLEKELFEAKALY